MKRLYFILGLVLSLILFSCEKEERMSGCESKCGKIVAQETITNQGTITWRIQVENVCSKNRRWKSETRYQGTGSPSWWNEDTYCFSEVW